MINMAENKGFFKKQATKIRKTGKDIADDSQEGSIISVAIAIINFVVTSLKALGESFGDWLSEINDKNKKGDK